MGVCLGLAFNKKFPGDDAWSKFTDGKDLVHAIRLFDEICAAKDVILFSELAGPDPDEIEDLVAELAPGEKLEDTWFTCTEGIRTVRALVDALQSEKQWSKGLRKSDLHRLGAVRK